MADIELVIKIPEEIYKASQIIDVKYEDVIQIPLEVIANGVSLPKRHGRLIDANALTNNSNIYVKWLNGVYKDFILTDAINNAPTIIEAERSENNGNDD